MIGCIQSTALVELFIAYSHLNGLDARSLPKRLEILDISGIELKEIAHLTKEQIPHLHRISIAMNQFPCDYVEQIKQTLHSVNLNSWAQKHGKNCQQNNQTAIDTSTK